MPITDLCAIVLAAGTGTRLRPLTQVRPKALCPVGNVPLLDRALDLVAGLGLSGPDAVAVNASWLAEQVVAHVGTRARVSVEPAPLGTAGGVARLRDWIDGRPVLVGNADAYLAGAIDPLVAGWDGQTVRLLGVPGDAGFDGLFRGLGFAGCSLLPWKWLPSEPGELVSAVWRPAESSGSLEVVEFPGYFRDTGTPADYLAANLHAAGSGNLVAPGAEVTGTCVNSVIGSGAVVHGSVTRSVLWPDTHVAPDEHLVHTIRASAGLDIGILAGNVHLPSDPA